MMRLRLWRRHPAGAKCREQLTDRSERMVVEIVRLVGRRILIGRDDGEPQILPDRRQLVGNAGPAVKDAAHRRIARVRAEDAARRRILLKQPSSASAGSGRDRNLRGLRQNKGTARIENRRRRDDWWQRQLRRSAANQQGQGQDREATGADLTHVTLHGAAWPSLVKACRRESVRLCTRPATPRISVGLPRMQCDRLVSGRNEPTKKPPAMISRAAWLKGGYLQFCFTPSASADRSPPGSLCRCGRRSSTGSASALRRSSCPRPEGSEEPAGPTGLAAAWGLLRQSGR